MLLGREIGLKATFSEQYLEIDHQVEGGAVGKSQCVWVKKKIADKAEPTLIEYLMIEAIGEYK